MVLQLFRASKGVEERKYSAVSGVVSFQGAGRATWSGRDSASLARNGFIGNPVGFRCVKMIAEAAADVGLVLADGERRYETHPMLSLLARPNQAEGRADLLEALFGQLLLSGDGYLEAAGLDEAGLPQELFVLRSDRMRVVPGADGWPVAYEYAVGAKKHRFDMRDEVKPVLHIKFFHPSDDHYGLAPMEAALKALDVHNSASAWSKSLLDNAARPSGAIVYKGADGMGSMAEDQYERLVSEMESHHQGARNAGRPMLLEGGLDWKPMGFSPSDMEFQKTKESAAREIALAFGVPPMLLGLPGDAAYANYAEANRAFYRQTVLPLVGKVMGALGNWLSDYYGAAISLKPDMDSVPALSIERESQWRRVANADFLTVAEKRAMLGLPVVMDE
ncbi:MAG: phage portal protein [Rhodobacteraceae bacterium]|nr:phage portal protein [Paracoccaceae bacterium]